MSDLFDGAIPDAPDPYEGMGHDAARTARRREMIAKGIHPATRLPLAGNGKTCGDCVHLWQKHMNTFSGWKCGLISRASQNDGPDMTRSWPACARFDDGGVAT